MKSFQTLGATMNAPLSATAFATTVDNFEVRRHETHHRIQVIDIDDKALRLFLDEARHVDVQNLDYVPFMRFYLGGLLARHAGDTFASTLLTLVRDRRFGGFTVGLKNLTEDPDDFVRFGSAIGHLLGPANHDAMSGNYYARFLVKHTDDSDSYLRQAYRLFTLHTDGTFVSDATDWLLMMKFEEKNAVGGESRFLHLDDWNEVDQFAYHRLGSKPFLYKSPGSKNVSEVIERPLFFHGEFGLSMSFIDQFVQPTNLEEALFLRELSNSMEASGGTKEVALPVGELVVLNNYFYLHGRAPFERNESLHRELMRIRGMLVS
ncbi:protein CsiD [Paraburkholderia sp. BL6665CI2N2]|uniref:glutarate dioxygenase GlaH n=1 Tax=Paraburkholderia sp. BL6665CI2N2 TaxID=1938806 RepID=UPI0010CEEF5E|nr:glutarate dioxygenase GlaH [Paraburkholderia sp. BL6665CI2N2]TDY15590.1 protein CsiD [Paraburkholderia sp. BL6665CI2N2]